MAIFRHTDYADYVDGYKYGDTYYDNNTHYLLKGDDRFGGSAARDIVYGGDGADDINGGYGNDTIYGERGPDYLQDNLGNDTVYGGDGRDYIVSEDGQYDVLFGGNGNDAIVADADKVNAGAGNDQIYLHVEGSDHADLTLGTGSDQLKIEIIGDTYNFNEYYLNEPTRVDVRDFKAEDHLSVTAIDDAHGSFAGPVVALDQLDRNNDGWLGAKDVETYDNGDGFSVHVGRNFLELDVLDTNIVLHGMTNASLDFLA